MSLITAPGTPTYYTYIGSALFVSLVELITI